MEELQVKERYLQLFDLRFAEEWNVNLKISNDALFVLLCFFPGYDSFCEGLVPV